MTKVITRSSKYGDTVENVKKWITDFHGLMLSAGLVQTSDTGQLDINSISAINNTLVPYGFKLYELLDSQSSNLRLLIKVEFCGHSWGNASGVGYGPATYISVGSTTDGAGNFTGLCKTARQISVGNHGSYGQGSGVADTANMIFAAEGRVIIVYGYAGHVYSNNYGTVAFAVVSRPTTSTGVPTAAGLHTLLQGQRTAGSAQTYSPCWSQYISPSTDLSPAANAAPCIGSPTGNGQVLGSVQCQPVYAITPEIVPMRDVICIPSAVFTAFNTFQVQHMSSQPRKFLALGGAAPVPDYYVNQAGWSLAVAADD